MAADANTLWELASRRATATPDAPVLLDDHSGSVSFGALIARSERVAAGLFQMGVGFQTPVTWQLPTSLDAVVTMLALARLGARQNPMVPLYREREMGSVVHQVRPHCIIVPRTWRAFDHESLARKMAADLGGPEVIVVDDGLPEADPATLPNPPAATDQWQYVYSTSGTTGDPKCVLHTDRSLLGAGFAMLEALDLGTDAVGCMPVPVAHVGGFSFLTAMLHCGFPTVLVDPWSTERAVELMNRHGATFMGGSTAHFVMLLEEQRKRSSGRLVPTLRMFTGGGAPLPAELFRQLADELGVIPNYGYGMTECPTIAMGSPHDSMEQLANTQGVLSAELEVQVLGETGETLQVGEEGEIELRGPLCFIGYADPEIHRGAFDGDGWFHTGDRGYIRPDRHVVLTGRSKDVIIRKGENISASEVETVVQMVPGVAAVAVIAVPDDLRGEMVCAVIELKAGAEAPTLDDVRRMCEQEGLMVQKQPERLEIVDELPRNAMLKVQKQQLRSRFALSEGTDPRDGGRQK